MNAGRITLPATIAWVRIHSPRTGKIHLRDLSDPRPGTVCGHPLAEPSTPLPSEAVCARCLDYGQKREAVLVDGEPLYQTEPPAWMAYVLDYGDFDDNHVIGVYTTLKAAKAARPLHPDCEPFRDVPAATRDGSTNPSNGFPRYHGHAWTENQYGAWESPGCYLVAHCADIQAFELDKQPVYTASRWENGRPTLDVR